MKNKKTEDKYLTLKNSVNANNSQSKLMINPEMRKINEDLLYFKNDILLEIRRVEEKLNLKFNEQSLIISEQYDSFEKKLSQMSDRINKIQTLILENSELTANIKIFMRFKNEAEINFNRINSKIFLLQKENMDFMNNIETMMNENLRYPGIFGRNAKFLNFRYFIDYTIKNFKDLNAFRDEIRKFNFKEFKKEINKDITDFRFSLSDNNKNSIRLIGNKFKELDTKIEDLIKRNNKNIRENEAKFEELKNNINKYFSEYQTKFESLEKNLNEKYNEQLNQVDDVKNMKDKLLSEINEVKSYFEKIKSSNNININSDIKTNINGRNHTNHENQKNIHSYSSINFGNQTIPTSSKKLNLIMNELINNDYVNNINKLDNYQNSEDRHNTEFSSNKIHHLNLVRPKSFQKLFENRYFQLINKEKDLSLTRNEIKKNEEKKEYSHFNMTNREFRRNNYSISNIKEIKIKKVSLPGNVGKRNINRLSSSLLSENKRTILISNDLSPSSHQKNTYLNNNKRRKSAFNISRIDRQNIGKYRNINFAYSSKTVDKIKSPENLSSLIIIKSKSKNNIFKNVDYFKQNKKFALSFNKEKNSKNEQLQTGFRKPFNLKNNIKELI